MQLAFPFDAAGAGVAVRASGQLALSPDLDVLAWVCERWLATPPRDPAGIARFTLRDLALDLYGEAGGQPRRLIRESLLRLFRVEVTLTGYDAIERRTDARLSTLSRLVYQIVTERGELHPAEEDRQFDPSAMGALRGSTFRVQLAPWLRDQLAAGHATFLDWRTLRRLEGIAKRAWVYLEAEQYKRTGQDREETWVGLGRPALAALGADGYDRPRDARRALNRAGARIVAVDPRYVSVTAERRPGGWALIAKRATGERLAARRELRGSLAAAG